MNHWSPCLTGRRGGFYIDPEKSASGSALAARRALTADGNYCIIVYGLTLPAGISRRAIRPCRTLQKSVSHTWA